MTTGSQNTTARGPDNYNSPNARGLKLPDKKAVAGYIFLPGFIPQIRELFKGGFGYFAFLIATIYAAVRILPANHPYTRYENIGKFGIRHVVATAANKVKFNKNNIDQIVVFFAILIAIVILFLQLISFALLMFAGDAWANGAGGGGGVFYTPNPQTDIAFHMMREVFGIPDMFGALDGGRTAFHQGLHVMFNFYNLAILLVAVLVFLYYVIVVVAETAKSGTPFGRRFSHIYAPFRLVIAIGLLVPLNYGLNAAQYITLFAAKMGSGFATTGWLTFNNVVDNPTGEDDATLIADVNAPDVQGLVEFMAMANSCRGANRVLEQRDVTMACAISPPDNTGQVQTAACNLANTGSSGPVKVVFGTQTGDVNGLVEPVCGTLTVAFDLTTNPQNNANGNPGQLQQEYLQMVEEIWNDADLARLAICFITVHVPGLPTQCPNGYQPDGMIRMQIINRYQDRMDDLVQDHFQRARDEVDFSMQEDIRQRGWGGAGIWYNRVAQINGAYVVSAMSSPTSERWPEIAEWVKNAKKDADARFKGCKIFEPNLADSFDAQFGDAELARKYAAIFNDSYQYWTCDKKITSANVFLDTVTAVFGLNGLMAIRDAGPNGERIHPLAKLSALGKGLVENAVRSLAASIGTSFMGGALGILSPHYGPAFQSASKMFVSIATIGLSIGFLTYYILPFLPFIYFFFAVGAWVKSIFEAMVGAPLWALAHLRIDGDGIPAKMAMNGYMLIFEIFLRPILTVFGLLGGMAIFAAMAMILNDVFDLVVVNVGGVNLAEAEDQASIRDTIDVFFFTCVYAVILYMMAVSSFKMINLVPNAILRWIGQSVGTFADDLKDPVGDLNTYAAVGGAKIGGKLAGGLNEASSGAGSLVGALLKKGSDSA